MLAAITIGINPIAFSIAGRGVRWYGIFVALAILVLIGLTAYRARKAGVPDDVVYKAAAWAIPAGFIVSRLLYVIDQIDYYALHPAQVIGFDGLTIYGAIVGGTLAVIIYALVTGEARVGQLLHFAAPGVILAQAIGLVGSIINGCCYGSATSLPFAFIYTNPNSYAPLGIATQPAVGYEFLYDLAVLGALLAVQRRVKPDGTLYGIYLALYAAGRFFIDFTRAGTPALGGLHQAQVVSLIVLAVTGFLLAYRRRLASVRLQAADVADDRSVEG